MPYVFEETQRGERRPASEFPSLSSEVFTETFAQAFEENPIASMYRGAQLATDYRSGGKKLDFLAASKALKARGMEGDIKVSEAGITEDALNTLMYRKGIEKRRQEVFGQAEGGLAQGAGRLGIGLVTGLIDPLNVASAFIPVIGEARYTSMLAKAGSALGRAGVRAGVGAVEGAVGAAMIEPIIAGSRRYEQADYGMADSLLNVAFGGLLGSGLHSVGGAISDGVNYYRGTEPAWRGMESVPHQEIPLVQNLRQEIAAGMDVRDIARVTETWSSAARAAVAADLPPLREVTNAEAAHQALPPQTREDALKQAIIQAASDEPVNVQPMIQAAAAKQIEAPEFQQWFRESQAVDPAGQPLRLYRNAAADVAEAGSRADGIHFTPAPEQRAARAVTSGRDTADAPAYVSIQNPKRIETFSNADAERAMAEGHDGLIVGGDRYVAFRPEQVRPAITGEPSTRDVAPADDPAKATSHAEKVLARETDTGTPTADALKMATEEATLAQSDLKAVADRLGMEAEDAELRDVLEAAKNSERWAKAAELATICLTRGG